MPAVIFIISGIHEWRNPYNYLVILHLSFSTVGGEFGALKAEVPLPNFMITQGVSRRRDRVYCP